jgi:hypothetical protein
MGGIREQREHDPPDTSVRPSCRQESSLPLGKSTLDYTVGSYRYLVGLPGRRSHKSVRLVIDDLGFPGGTDNKGQTMGPREQNPLPPPTVPQVLSRFFLSRRKRDRRQREAGSRLQHKMAQ